MLFFQDVNNNRLCFHCPQASLAPQHTQPWRLPKAPAVANGARTLTAAVRRHRWTSPRPRFCPRCLKAPAGGGKTRGKPAGERSGDASLCSRRFYFLLCPRRFTQLVPRPRSPRPRGRKRQRGLSLPGWEGKGREKRRREGKGGSDRCCEDGDGGRGASALLPAAVLPLPQVHPHRLLHRLLGEPGVPGYRCQACCCYFPV